MSITVAEISRVEAPLGRLGAAAALAALGVYLIWDHPPGLGLAAFLAAVMVGAIAAAGRAWATAALAGLLALAPLVEAANALSIGIALFGLGAVVLLANDAGRGDFAAFGLGVSRFFGRAPFAAVCDLPGVARLTLRGGADARKWLGWLLPSALGCVFLALFAAANPIIANWIAEVGSLLSAIDLARIGVGFALAALVWPCLNFHVPAPAAGRATAREPASAWRAAAFSKRAVLRSLLLFNAMFAVQTALDAAILGRGAALPQGVSFAAYAHRGAYPLVATALLAGAFVIVAMRPGSEAAASRPIRALVVLWIAQNVALVVSSVYRLDLYVRVYALTYWRVAAFVWMALVAVGLALILVQIALARSHRWLLSANLAVAAAALYLVAFVNLDHFIADYNLRHNAEVSGESAALDVDYLLWLGPQAIPALEVARARGLKAGQGVRDSLLAQWRARDPDWRAWSFRASRLARELEPAP